MGLSKLNCVDKILLNLYFILLFSLYVIFTSQIILQVRFNLIQLLVKYCRRCDLSRDQNVNVVVQRVEADSNRLIPVLTQV